MVYSSAARLRVHMGDGRVGTHKVGRRLASTAIVIGWIVVVLPLITIMYIGISIFGPGGPSLVAVVRLFEIIPFGVAGFVIVLFGHVARAVFDIAERALVGPASS